jgi:hypothetical protein
MISLLDKQQLLRGVPAAAVHALDQLERLRSVDPQRERHLAMAQQLNARLTREIGQRVQMELAVDELLRAHAQGEPLELYIQGLAEARRPYSLPNERGPS